MQHFRGGMDHWILHAPADLLQQGRLSCLTMLELGVRAAKRLAQPDDVGRVVAFLRGSALDRR
jgi:hypothetical protein